MHLQLHIMDFRDNPKLGDGNKNFCCVLIPIRDFRDNPKLGDGNPLMQAP